MREEKKLVFEFNWKLSLAVLLLLPVLVSLSIWQVQRAAEKGELQQLWLSQQALQPKDFLASDEFTPYQRVRAQGKFAPEKYWLRENQFINGKLGYNVIMRFDTANGETLAIDRGWVEGNAYRDFIPQVSTPSETIVVTGTLSAPSDSMLIREAEVSAKTWPHKILEIDLPVMGKQAQVEFYPKVLRLDADSAAAFVVDWKPVNMSPAKHYGYAVQWGLMALVLLVLYLFASTNLSRLLKTS